MVDRLEKVETEVRDNVLCSEYSRKKGIKEQRSSLPYYYSSTRRREHVTTYTRACAASLL